MKKRIVVEWEDDNISKCICRATLLSALRDFYGNERIDKKLADGTLKVKDLTE